MAERWESQEAGQFVLDFLSFLPLSDGSGPLRLQPWQTEPIAEFYGTLTEDDQGRPIRAYQYLYQEVPKKNGKTELAAALGVYHLIGDGEPNPEVYCVAADKDNANIVFRAAVYMIEHTPALRKMVKRRQLVITESTRTVRYNGGVMKVLSSEAYSKHGYKPSCVIFDELHAQKDRDLWDVMTFGAGDARRQPVWLVLTTAGDDPDRTSIGWEVHCKAMDILRARGQVPPVLEEDGTPRQYEDNPLWLPVIYGMSRLTRDDDDAVAGIDIYDEAVWRACNPSLGVTVPLRMVRAEAAEARKSEAAERLFRWLRLNQWISTKAVGWIPLTIYDKTQAEGTGTRAEREAFLARLQGLTCYGGLDLSSTTDLTAFVLIFPPQKGLDTWVMVPRAWIPLADIQAKEKRDHVPYRDWIRAGFLEGCEGDMMDYEAVIEAVVQAGRNYRLELLGIDPYLSRTIAARLTEQEIPVAEIPQTIPGLSPAMKELERMIRAHQMLHMHNTCARWCFGNVRCAVDGNENMKPMKNKSTGRIDIVVAWIIAMAAAMVKRSEKPDLAAAMDREDFSL